MNKYLQYMADAKKMVEGMIERDISFLLSKISNEQNKYSFRFHAGAWDWMLNGEALVFSTKGYEHKGEARVLDVNSAQFEEIDKAIVALIKEYNFGPVMKTINAAAEVKVCNSVAEEKSVFLKHMTTLAEGVKSGLFAPKN